MIIEIERDLNNSTDKRPKYKVLDSGYLVKNNLSMTNAKKVRQLVMQTKNTKSKLRKLKITNSTGTSYGWK